MTIIAYKDGVLAGDGRLAITKTGGIVSENDVKVFKLSDCLLGVAGQAESCQILIDATRNGHTPRKLKAEGLKITPDGKVFLFEGGGWFPVHEKHCAIGVGELQAVMAMDLGATAVEAVKAVCRRNIFCGGRIRKVSF